jgi:hypothetical protein
VPNPITYSSARQFVGIAKETTQGTAVTPTVTIPVDKFEPEDKPTWIDDKALRGSMTDVINRVQGPLHSELSFSGPLFFDWAGYLLNNILGDLVESGTYTGSGTTTLSSSSTAGATTISTALSIAALTVIQIDTGTLSEVRTVQSVTGAGPYTLTLNTALTYAHNSSVVVKPITTPYIHTMSLLNSGAGQPGSLTFTDYQGPTASVSARAYPGACLSELTLKGNPESTSIEYDAKAMAWPSAAAAATPTSAPSTVQPMAAWRTVVGIAGPASGGTQVKTVGDWEIAIKREVELIFTGQNSQNPYFIQRGKVSVTGKLNFVAVADETPLTYLLSNTQPQLQLIASNGLSGANLLSIQFDVQQAGWNASKIDRSKAAVGYQTDYVSVANTTNAGGSGGFSPLSIVLQNAVAPNSY